MLTDCSSVVLDHLARRPRSDTARFRRHHSFCRGFGSEVLARARCILVFALKAQAFKVFVTTRNLEDSFGVDFALGTVSVPDFNLGAFHVEDQSWF